MSDGKAAGPDEVPAEACERSPAAEATLFDLVDDVFVDEATPHGVATGEFVVTSKPKEADDDDPESCRALSMLDCASDVLSGTVVERTVAETEGSVPEWKGGFCEGRGQGRDVRRPQRDDPRCWGSATLWRLPSSTAPLLSIQLL